MKLNEVKKTIKTPSISPDGSWQKNSLTGAPSPSLI